MPTNEQQKRLGKGLKALLSTYSPDQEDRYMSDAVSVDAIRPHPNQPRRTFSEEGMEDLIQSIRENGILQPLTVHDVGEGCYELIAGERRLRAARALKMATVPVYVISVDTDVELLEYALIENVQREDLDPIEEAEGYAVLSGKYNLTQEDIAQKVGKSRATVANAIRLLRLPVKIKDGLKNNIISTGHARALLGLDNPEQIQNIFERICRDSLSVRQTEELVRRMSEAVDNKPTGGVPHKPKKSSKSEVLLNFENQLRGVLGTKVGIRRNRTGKGQINIDFYSDDDLVRILDLISRLED